MYFMSKQVYRPFYGNWCTFIPSACSPTGTSENMGISLLLLKESYRAPYLVFLLRSLSAV